MDIDKITTDDSLEQEWLEEVSRLNKTLLPCPSCGGTPYLSICVWDCCKSSIRNIECDCGVYSGPSIEDWNNRTAEIRNFWDDIETMKEKNESQSNR